MIQYYSISFNRVLSPKSTVQVLAEIARVLASGGAFVSISHDKHREKLYEEHLPGTAAEWISVAELLGTVIP